LLQPGGDRAATGDRGRCRGTAAPRRSCAWRPGPHRGRDSLGRSSLGRCCGIDTATTTLLSHRRDSTSPVAAACTSVRFGVHRAWVCNWRGRLQVALELAVRLPLRWTSVEDLPSRRTSGLGEHEPVVQKVPPSFVRPVSAVTTGMGGARRW
jgi:hypothetical protein